MSDLERQDNTACFQPGDNIVRGALLPVALADRGAVGYCGLLGSESKGHGENAPEVILRRFPFPYHAMLAICSDLDSTHSGNVYFGTMEFLNTSRSTSMGMGLNMEVGNTINFYAAPDQYSYWNADDTDRSLLRAMIMSGHIDCIHSYGEMAKTREQVGRALDELTRNDCKIKVWVDHGGAVTNFGPDIMSGRGDVIGSEAYHADLTCEYGIEYAWMGRVTSVIGQGAPWSIRGILDNAHPFESLKTVAKEIAKNVLGKCGNKKYHMHGTNNVLRKTTLRSGHGIIEFMRSNPHWAGVGEGATGDDLGSVINPRMLEILIEREGVSVIYTHLGKGRNRTSPLSSETIKALRVLSQMYHEGRILVTTTYRVLRYCRMMRELDYSALNDNGFFKINIVGPETEESLAGMTFYVNCPEKTTIMLNGYEIKAVLQNGPDHTGRRSVSIPWQRLEYPCN